MKNFWEKFKLCWREIGNLLTNILCPLISLIITIMDFFHLPASAIQFMKKVEYWCFYACATKDKIDELVENIDVEAIEEEAKEKEGE